MEEDDVVISTDLSKEEKITLLRTEFMWILIGVPCCYILAGLMNILEIMSFEYVPSDLDEFLFSSFVIICTACSVLYYSALYPDSTISLVQKLDEIGIGQDDIFLEPLNDDEISRVEKYNECVRNLSENKPWYVKWSFFGISPFLMSVYLLGTIPFFLLIGNENMHFGVALALSIILFVPIFMIWVPFWYLLGYNKKSENYFYVINSNSNLDKFVCTYCNEEVKNYIDGGKHWFQTHYSEIERVTKYEKYWESKKEI